MMTNITEDEIERLAKEYVADVYDGDTDFIAEAENVMTWLFRTHCIVENESVRSFYSHAKRKYESGRESGFWLGQMEMLKFFFDDALTLYIDYK